MYSMELRIWNTNTNNDISFRGNPDDEMVLKTIHCMELF